jgi:hypothetical protein
MGSLSDYAENKLCDLAFGAQAFARVANVFASLHTATLNDNASGLEVTGNSYARKSIANNATNFPGAASRAKALAVQQAFAASTGSWGTVTDSGLWDASTSGNLLIADTITTPRAVGTGEAPYIAAATGLTVSLSGDVSTYLGNALLDHMLGGPDFTPAATLYFAAFVAGVEVSGNGYARKPVANNATNFPAAVAGLKALAVAQEFDAPSGSWGLVDELRVFDDLLAGNLYLSKSLTVARTVGLNAPCRFSAGAFTFALS